jgi:hypothetical protein
MCITCIAESCVIRAIRPLQNCCTARWQLSTVLRQCYYCYSCIVVVEAGTAGRLPQLAHKPLCLLNSYHTVQLDAAASQQHALGQQLFMVVAEPTDAAKAQRKLQMYSQRCSTVCTT